MRLNQIIALETGIKSQTYSKLTELNKLVQKAELFNGFVKTFEKSNEDLEDLAGDHKKIQQSIDKVLLEVLSISFDYWGVVAQKEWSNCVAKANVIVDGAVLLHDVPVGFLLFLEKQLTDLRTFVNNLPVLDSSMNWEYNETSGCYKTPVNRTHKTKKVQKVLVKYPATPEHPAQTDVVSEDILHGYWSTQNMSAALSVPERDLMNGRVEKVLRAVKSAREEANNLEEVAHSNIRAILTYIFEM